MDSDYVCIEKTVIFSRLWRVGDVCVFHERPNKWFVPVDEHKTARETLIERGVISPNQILGKTKKIRPRVPPDYINKGSKEYIELMNSKMNLGKGADSPDKSVQPIALGQAQDAASKMAIVQQATTDQQKEEVAAKPPKRRGRPPKSKQ